MEQRKSLSLAERIKMHPIRKPPKTRNQSAQNKPRDARKGKRRPAGKTAALKSPKARHEMPRKKPGRAKQTQPKPASKKKRSPK